MNNSFEIKTALLSVYNKTGIVELASFLHEKNVRMIATGSTYKLLLEHNLNVTAVEDYTEFPEMMDGRVKTLHPKIHGAILADRDKAEHMNDVRRLTEGGTIDLVVVNLYPFRDNPSIETIDVGGPAMLRAAAKNYTGVCAITDIVDYTKLQKTLAAHDMLLDVEFSRACAAKIFGMISDYDRAIADWLGNNESFMGYVGKKELRYGENPGQDACFYGNGNDKRSFRKILGAKELSYNNIADADAAFRIVNEFSELAAIAIVKHNNPCGVAVAEFVDEAYKAAYACDSTSAFGGVLASNSIIDKNAASEIVKVFTEVVIAPGYTDEALAMLEQKKNLRVLLMCDAESLYRGKQLRNALGGILLQEWDRRSVVDDGFCCVTKAKPTAAQINDMLFADTVCKHVKSNAIVIAAAGKTLGIGAGQMNRVGSVKLAVASVANYNDSSDLVMASDAFFPFADGIIAAAEAGVKAIIQPGGSMRDNEVIEAADQNGIVMLFTDIRHFKH